VSLPYKPVLFLDNSLDQRSLAEAIRALGYVVYRHRSEFVEDMLDIHWLPVVGEREWIVLAKDQALRTRRDSEDRTILIELNALKAARVGVFVLTQGGLRGPDVIQIVLSALPEITRVSQTETRPFLYKIKKDGSVEKYDI
jgi:hypothetical protein